MCGEFDGLVSPLRRAVHARDERAAMYSAKVAGDERVPRLGLLTRPNGQAEMPRGIVGPPVTFEVVVLSLGVRLTLAPVALEHILTGRDQLTHTIDSGVVHLIGSHDLERSRQRGSPTVEALVSTCNTWLWTVLGWRTMNRTIRVAERELSFVDMFIPPR